MKSSSSHFNAVKGLSKTHKDETPVPIRIVTPGVDAPPERPSLLIQQIVKILEKSLEESVDSTEAQLRILHELRGLDPEIDMLISLDIEKMFDNINPVDACLALVDLILECKELEMPMCDDNYIRWLVTTEVSEQWVRKYDGQDLLLERRPASRPVPANLVGIRRTMFTEYVEKRSKLTDKQRRLGVALILAHASLQCCDQSHIRWQGKFFRGKKGLPTGSRLSPLLAGVYVTIWRRKVTKRCQEYGIKIPTHNGRYVDDNLALFSHGYAEFRRFVDAANSVNTKIQVTYEIGDPKGVYGKPKIRHLNFICWISQDGKVQFMHTRKEGAGRGCPRIDSALPKKMMKNIISNEAMTILMCCSQQKFAELGLFDLKIRLAAAGHKKVIVEAMIMNAKARWQGIVDKHERGERSLYRNNQEKLAEHVAKHGTTEKTFGPPGDKVSGFIDFVSDDFTRSMNSLAKKCNLDATIRARGGTKLISIYGTKADPVISSNPPPCCPNQASDPIWLTKGVVYEAKCLDCPPDVCSNYIGQTGETTEARIKRHSWATRTGRDESALSQHYMAAHPNKVHNPQFEVKLIDRPSSKPKRLISEALLIHERKPSLNLQFENGVSQNVELYIDHTVEQRQSRMNERNEILRRQWGELAE